MKVVFIISVIKDSHYRNRILDFMNEGCEVEVYAFQRADGIATDKLVYPYHIE